MNPQSKSWRAAVMDVAILAVVASIGLIITAYLLLAAVGFLVAVAAGLPIVALAWLAVRLSEAWGKCP